MRTVEVDVLNETLSVLNFPLQSTVFMLKQAIISRHDLLGTPPEYELVHGCEILKDDVAVADTQIFDKYRPKLIRVRGSSGRHQSDSSLAKQSADLAQGRSNLSLSVQVSFGSSASPRTIQVLSASDCSLVLSRLSLTRWGVV
jgi:hypothetical protein